MKNTFTELSIEFPGYYCVLKLVVAGPILEDDVRAFCQYQSAKCFKGELAVAADTYMWFLTRGYLASLEIPKGVTGLTRIGSHLARWLCKFEIRIKQSMEVK